MFTHLRFLFIFINSICHHRCGLASSRSAPPPSFSRISGLAPGSSRAHRRKLACPLPHCCGLCFSSIFLICASVTNEMRRKFKLWQINPRQLHVRRYKKFKHIGQRKALSTMNSAPIFSLATTSVSVSLPSARTISGRLSAFSIVNRQLQSAKWSRLHRLSHLKRWRRRLPDTPCTR